MSPQKVSDGQAHCFMLVIQTSLVHISALLQLGAVISQQEPDLKSEVGQKSLPNSMQFKQISDEFVIKISSLDYFSKSF